MIVLLLFWWWISFAGARAQEARAVRAELQRDELRSRIEHAGPLWRRDDDMFPGSRW